MKARAFLCTFAAAGFLLLAANAQAATITVTGTGDTIAVDQVVTLREAITSANTNASVNADVSAQSPGAYGNDTINFNIAGAGVHTISLTAALPSITGPITINGYSQGIASVNTLPNGDNAVLLIELNGSGAGAGMAKVGIAGLTLGAGSGGSVIEGLVINRFSGDGIRVETNGNTISGNFIGTNPAGTAGGNGIGNANTTFDLVTPFRAGIFVENVSFNTIGGPAPAARNVISGNILDNIHIFGSASASGNAVQGNFIGVGANGTSILFASGFWGIEVGGINASGNLIGGTTSGARNVVGGNGDGIELDDGAFTQIVQGNFVGVGADGVTPAGNRLHGIALKDLGGSPGVSSNQIGGTQSGAGNVVANNGSAGIAIFGNPSVSLQNMNNSILGNSIFNNGRTTPGSLLGIDLVSGTAFPTDDGNTPNDPGDGDVGPNNLQNFPVLTAVSVASGSTTVTGSLNSRNNDGAGRAYRIEFFSSPAASGTGFGEGQTFLGFTNVTLGANPGPFIDQGETTASFSATLPGEVAMGSFISATATELIAGAPLGTSEFSNALPAFPTPAPTPTPTPVPVPTPAKLGNISTRAFAQTGDSVVIAGFIVVGESPINVIVRAIGPSLPVPGAMADPTLELHDGNGGLIDSNDNWVDSANKQAIINSTLAPSNDLEAAILATLPANNTQYTAVVRGAGDTSGVVVVEVYNLP
jgi:hypothetical protein